MTLRSLVGSGRDECLRGLAPPTGALAIDLRRDSFCAGMTRMLSATVSSSSLLSILMMPSSLLDFFSLRCERSFFAFLSCFAMLAETLLPASTLSPLLWPSSKFSTHAG